MFGVGDHVTWACSGVGVGVGEVGVVQGLSADGFEAALAFQQGAFCLELCDLLKAGAAPPRRVPGCKSPRSSAGPAPRRPARAFEEGDYGGSAASSRRLTFGGRDGDEDDGGTDRGHGSNDDGAWGTDGATPSGGRVSGAGAGAAVRWGPIGVGDAVVWSDEDEDVPKGTVGTVLKLIDATTARVVFGPGRDQTLVLKLAALARPTQARTPTRAGSGGSNADGPAAGRLGGEKSDAHADVYSEGSDGGEEEEEEEEEEGEEEEDDEEGESLFGNINLGEIAAEPGKAAAGEGGSSARQPPPLRQTREATPRPAQWLRPPVAKAGARASLPLKPAASSSVFSASATSALPLMARPRTKVRRERVQAGVGLLPKAKDEPAALVAGG
jgi:hypothetical protein